MKRPTFNVPDLVKLKVPAREKTPEAQHAYGQIVPYRGEHDPEDPRVRWNSAVGQQRQAIDLTL
jgi:hypothetical protein